MRTVLSPLQLASSFPDGAQLTCHTRSVCPAAHSVSAAAAQRQAAQRRSGQAREILSEGLLTRQRGHTRKRRWLLSRRCCIALGLHISLAHTHCPAPRIPCPPPRPTTEHVGDALDDRRFSADGTWAHRPLLLSFGLLGCLAWCSAKYGVCHSSPRGLEHATLGTPAFRTA